MNATDEGTIAATATNAMVTNARATVRANTVDPHARTGTVAPTWLMSNAQPVSVLVTSQSTVTCLQPPFA